MEAILQKYVINSVDDLLNITKWKYDPNIPLSVYVRFRDGAGIVDLVFGMEISNQRGFVFSSTRLPYEFSFVALGFREKENQCHVYIVEAGPSGIVWLYLRNDVHLGFNSVNLAEINNPTFYTFPLVKSE